MLDASHFSRRLLRRHLMSTEFTVAAYLSYEFENVANSLLERATGGTPQVLPDAAAPQPKDHSSV